MLAAFRASAQSLEKAKGNDRHFSALFSLVSKSRFPETETGHAETGSTEAIIGRRGQAAGVTIRSEDRAPGNSYDGRERAFDRRVRRVRWRTS